MKKTTVILSLSVVVFGGTFLLARSVFVAQAQGADGAFVASFVEKRFNEKGEQIFEEHLLRAVRGDRSQAEVMRHKESADDWVEFRKVLDLQARKRYSIDPVSKSITTYGVSESEWKDLAAPHITCSAEPNPETATILGYPAVKVVSTGGDPLPVKWERWYSPALSCFFPLKETFRWANTSGLITTREVTFILPGEPPASMFAIPGDYQERTPSEAMVERSRLLGRSKPVHPETKKLLDSVYDRRNK